MRPFPDPEYECANERDHGYDPNILDHAPDNSLDHSTDFIKPDRIGGRVSDRGPTYFFCRDLLIALSVTIMTVTSPSPEILAVRPTQISTCTMAPTMSMNTTLTVTVAVYLSIFAFETFSSLQSNIRP